MNLNEAKKDLYYTDQKQLLENNSRKNILNNNKESFMRFLDTLEIEYDVNDIFLVNEGLKKHKYNIEILPIYFETTRRHFEDIVDSKLVQRYSNLIECFVKTEKEVYLLGKDGHWRLVEEPSQKMSIKNIIYGY